MNILIIYGGASCEHDISIITAGLAKRHFVGRLYCCYIDQDNNAWLVDSWLKAELHKGTRHSRRVIFGSNSHGIEIVGKWNKKVTIHCAVNCCHGGIGEGGDIAGVLAVAGIPMVGSNSIASGIAMDKIHTKHILLGAQMPVVEGVGIDAMQYASGQYRDIVSKLSYPLIAKPATLGSSIGIGVAQDATQLDSVLEVALGYDSRVLVENMLTPCIEYNCAVMRVDGSVMASRVDVPMSSGQILSFADKYLSGGKSALTTTEVDSVLASQIADMSIEVYQLLDMSGVVRIDYIVHQDKLYINEINTIPGSLAYSLWQHQYSATQYGTVLVQEAIRQYQHRSAIISQYTSNVLDTTRLNTTTKG